MNIRKIGGIFFWRLGVVGGSVYIVKGQRSRAIADAAFAIGVGAAFGLLIGFNI